MATKKLEVVITGNAKGAQRAFGQTEKAAGGLASKLGGVGSKVGTAMTLGFGAAVTGAAILGPQLFDLGGKLDAWALKASTVFEGAAGSVRKWADANNESFGMTDEELTGLAAGFGDLLKPMGFTAQQAADMSTKVVGLSGALSEWSGGTRSAAEVSDILAKAMLGERDGLKELGISISEADVQSRLAAKGQDKLTGAALEQAKAMATQELIFEKSTDAQKAYAEGGNRTIRAGNKLKAMFGELQVWLAGKVVPALTTAAEWLGKMPEHIRTFGDWMERNRPIVIGVAAAISTVLVAAFVAWAAAAIPAAVATIAATWPLLALIAVVGLVAAGLVWAYENVDWFREAVQKVASFITDTAVPALRSMWAWFAEKILPIIKQVAGYYFGAYAAAFRKAAEVAVFLAGKIQALWGWFSRNLLPTIRTVASALAGGLAGAFSRARSAAAVLSSAASAVSSRLGGLRNVAAATAAAFAGTVRAGFAVAGMAINSVRSGISLLANALDRVISLARRAAAAISSIPSPGEVAGSIISAIPGRATGGPVVAGKAYMVGENGPELFVSNDAGTIIPNDQLSVPAKASSLPLGSSTGGDTVILQLTVEGSVLTERKLVEVVRDGMIDLGRRTGRPVLAGFG